MPQVFDKEKREQATNGLATIYGTVPDLTMDYIKALEEVAKAAKTLSVYAVSHYTQETEFKDAQSHLYDALTTVDWMNE